MNITGVKRAVCAYKRAMALGNKDPWYAEIMLDCETGDVWADVFFDIKHNEHKKYESATVINLTNVIAHKTHSVNALNVSMQMVRQYAEHCCQWYANTGTTPAQEMHYPRA